MWKKNLYLGVRCFELLPVPHTSLASLSVHTVLLVKLTPPPPTPIPTTLTVSPHNSACCSYPSSSHPLTFNPQNIAYCHVAITSPSLSLPSSFSVHTIYCLLQLPPLPPHPTPHPHSTSLAFNPHNKYCMLNYPSLPILSHSLSIHTINIAC